MFSQNKNKKKKVYSYDNISFFFYKSLIFSSIRAGINLEPLFFFPLPFILKAATTDDARNETTVPLMGVRKVAVHPMLQLYR